MNSRHTQTQQPWDDDRLAPNGRPVRENFADWFGKSKVLNGPLLSPTLLKIIQRLRTLPFAEQIRVFGSTARAGAAPNDLDIFVDLRSTKADPDQFRVLLSLARAHYGWIDPFLRTDSGLLVRNDHATGWTRAKNASAIEEAMDRDGKPIPQQGRPLVVYHGTNRDFDAFKGATYLTSHPGQAADYAANNADASGGAPRILPLYASLQNPALVDGDYAEWAGYEATEIERLIAAGHDGLMNAPMTEIVAFHPGQIKSAIGNSGLYDPSNPCLADAVPAPQPTSNQRGPNP